MRIRRASPLLLLLAPSLISALPNERSTPPSLDRKRDAQPEAPNAPSKPREPAVVVADGTSNSRSTQSSRPYRGTEDAPVDGLDGKPHAGPFVDTTPEESKSRKAGAPADATQTAKARPTSLDNFKTGSDEWRLEDIPEKNDGVMNDENRVAPKKGTTGTEGGISEKEKERRLKGAGENKPQEPKEAPPLPHSEQERIEEEQKGNAEKGNKQSVGSGKGGEKGDASSKKESEFGVGGYGMEKPSNLPDKPHNLPHPEPKIATGGGGGGSKDSNGWFTDTMPYTEGQTSKRPPPKTNPDGSTTPSSPSGDVDENDEETWHEWIHSFVLSLTMILFSEIGDKTFLIAALMAMRHPRILVFSAAFGALIVMTVLSAVLGHALPAFLPKRLTTFAAALLFLVFGAKMLREGLAMPRDSGVGEEMKEVEAELEEKEHSMALDRSRRRASSSVAGLSPYTLEAGRGRQQKSSLPHKGEPSPPSSRSRSHSPPKDRLSGLMNLCSLVLSPAWVQTFIMTFLGEWGDRSQIATIAMAAGQDYWWVTLGAITGHAFCTGLAVVGGRALAGRVSMRVVTIGGALAFLVFGVIYLFECITEA